MQRTLLILDIYASGGLTQRYLVLLMRAYKVALRSPSQGMPIG